MNLFHPLNMSQLPPSGGQPGAGIGVVLAAEVAQQPLDSLYYNFFLSVMNGPLIRDYILYCRSCSVCSFQ